MLSHPSLSGFTKSFLTITLWFFRLIRFKLNDVWILRYTDNWLLCYNQEIMVITVNPLEAITKFQGLTLTPVTQCTVRKFADVVKLGGVFRVVLENCAEELMLLNKVWNLRMNKPTPAGVALQKWSWESRWTNWQ